MKISVGQALLILIDYHQQDLEIYNELRALYLSGASNPTALKRLKFHLRNHPALDGYTISPEASTTDDDPTRRYFETHLAQETINNTLLSANDLENHFKQLYKFLPNEYKTSEKKQLLDSVLNGHIHTAKFDYETKLRNYTKAMKTIVDDVYLSFEKKAAAFSKIQGELRKDMNTSRINNSIESKYKSLLGYIDDQITRHHNSSLSELRLILNRAEDGIRKFKQHFSALDNDPTFDNTGSSIIYAAAIQKDFLVQLNTKINALNHDDYQKAFLEIYGLLKLYLPLFENNIVQKYLLPSIKKWETLENKPISKEEYAMLVGNLVENINLSIDNLRKVYTTARCGYLT
ncbi:MAG TPA: hypothetical protein PLD88_05015, partial [Candidatus Berkiella sp.]|nr:hypothetical protein [Candidatus Berkiella sp.]